MATITELVISRTFGKTAAALNYVIKETASETTALSLLVSSTPPVWGMLVRNNWSVEPVGDPTLTLTWLGTVTYGTPNDSNVATGESVFSFDTTGGTQHITQSLATSDSDSVATDTPDFKQSINVSTNGENQTVNGVDKVVPVYSFTEMHVVADEDVTTAFKRAIFDTTGKVNTDVFKGTDPGECLFLGASGRKRNEDEWEITYNFAASPNKAAVIINGMTVAKKGWEYLWVSYAETDDTTAKKIVKTPVAVYVEEVYEKTAFSALGL